MNRNELIRQDRANGMTLRMLHEKYELSLSQLSRITSGIECDLSHPMSRPETLQAKLDAGMTARQIALEANVPVGTVRYWIRKLRGATNSARKPSKASPTVIDGWDNEGWFKQQYEQLGLGIPTIARKIGRSVGFVSNRLELYGVQRRTLRQAMQKLQRRPPKQWLEEKYDKCKWSIQKCADDYGVSFDVIFEALRDYGISIRGASEQQTSELNSFYGKQHTPETKEYCKRIGAKIGAEYWVTGDVEAKKELSRATASRIWRDPEKRARASQVIAGLCKEGKCNPKSRPYCTRNGNILLLRSSWEEVIAKFLDSSDVVSEWAFEDTLIPYMDESEVRHFVVDFTITWIDGSRTLLEVKNEHLLSSSKEQSKIDALKEYAEQHNISCLVISSRSEVKKTMLGKRPHIEWLTQSRYQVNKSYLECSELAIEEMVHAILARIIPWKHPQYTEQELSKDLVRLRKENLSSYGDVELVATTANSGGTPGKKLINHFQPHFWDVACKNALPISAAFHSRSLVEKNLRQSIRERESLSFERLLREINFHSKHTIASHFAPGFGRKIIRMFGAANGVVFDPCCGWGGRLLASWLEGCTYIGCEVSPLTFKGLLDIAQYVGYSVEIHNRSCLDIDWPQSDLIFTSPPFFDVERYVGGDQPWLYNARQQWLDEFVKPFVDRINACCVLYLDERTKNDFETFRKFDRVIAVKHRRHPRMKTGVELLCVYNG